MRLQFKILKKNYRIICFVLLFFSSLQGSGQFFNPSYYANSLSVGKNTYANGSAWLEVGDNPTKKGLLLPRVLHPDSIKNPVAGLIVFSLHDGFLYYRNNTAWTKICTCGELSPPVFSFSVHPLSQTVAPSSPFSFTASVQNGTGPYTWTWYVLGNPTPVATTTTSVPTRTQSIGGTSTDVDYYVTCSTSANGTITSDTAHITVSTDVVITYGYSSTDPYIDNSTAPTISNSATTTVAHNADISVSYPAAAVDKFLVFKVPTGETTKSIWYSSPSNNGTIGDAAFRASFVVGGFRYYVTRDAAGLAFDYTLPIQLKL